jgi:hypothetical protein
MLTAICTPQVARHIVVKAQTSAVCCSKLDGHIQPRNDCSECAKIHTQDSMSAVHMCFATWNDRLSQRCALCASASTFYTILHKAYLEHKVE